VRVEGSIAKTSENDSDDYFAKRPRGHQIGAWASAQSSVIESREALAARVTELEVRFGTAPVPRPPFWGGYRLTPVLLEFWQGQDNRLHDRLRYQRHGPNWRIDRLSP
jgi:pyridoxamine 5'-phosphate oxidase